MASAPTVIELQTSTWPAYTLLDAGLGRKLEKVGPYTLIRSEPKAWWQPTLTDEHWHKYDAALPTEGQRAWQLKRSMPKEWTLTWEKLTLGVRLTTMSKHIGVFPEHDAQWRWIRDQVQEAPRPLKILNLFGYTGVASLVAAQAGAQVTHVDASKAAIGWARANQTLSGLQAAPIRWILDDALKFVKREIRRGQTYDALILDPPAFGRGPSGQLWRLPRDLPELLTACAQLLVPEPHFIYLTTYTADASSVLLGNLLQDMIPSGRGKISVGELGVLPTSGPKPLSLSIYGRWSA